MRRINLADSSFLYLENRETPMHVGGLSLFTLPEGIDEKKFLAKQVEVLHAAENLRKPFGELVSAGRAGPMGPLYWERDEDIDLDYHIRHSALPQPGRFRELFALVGRLHGSLLDRSRPLWEVHLIEGLQDRQFALYMKMHHAAIDGVGAIHLMQAMCSTRKSARVNYSPMSLEAYESYKAAKYSDRPPLEVKPTKRELRLVTEALKDQFQSTVNLTSAFKKFGSVFLGGGGNLTVPWHKVPQTSFNTRVSSGRRFVAQSWSFERVKTVCKALDGTLNDIVLAMCAGALRRYLKSQNELPKESLKAMTPVSLRADGDLESANAVGFITADLSTNIANPEKRLRAIQNSMNAGKQLLRGMSARESVIFTQLTQAPAILTSIFGLAARYPAFSTVISNVPGPKKRLHWNGARLDGIYPANIVFDGFALGITLVSYDDSLDFGIVACRKSVPQVQRIIDYLEDSLSELEEIGGLRTVTAKRPAGKKRKTTVKKKRAARAK